MLYESITEGQDYLNPEVHNNRDCHSHDLCNMAVELMRRNFFVMTSGIKAYANYPVQGMKWDHSESYYPYC